MKPMLVKANSVSPSSIHRLFFIIAFMILSQLSTNVSCRGVVVNGGEVSVGGAVTDTQIDLTIDYTANVKWILMIWGPD